MPIVGETIVVETRTQVGVNSHRQKIYEWEPEDVEDVLVAPGPRNDIPDTSRPDGVVVVFHLHFPKTWTGSLAGRRIIIRGGEPLHVVGDPQPYMDANTPGRWNRPVEVSRADG